MSQDKTHDEGLFVNTQKGEECIAYPGAFVRDCELGNHISIGNDTTLSACVIGNHVAINRRSYINNSIIGDYSYTGINSTINFARIGKFCSFARNVDIGGFDHDYKKITTMPEFRFNQMMNLSAGKAVPQETEELCNIGNDVWIAAGAIVLHKVKIGDGAVIGAGSVVTKDALPYGIYAGVPAKLIKFRFPQSLIDRLLRIAWWNLPESTLKAIAPFLMKNDVNEDNLSLLEDLIAIQNVMKEE